MQKIEDASRKVFDFEFLSLYLYDMRNTKIMNQS